MIEELLAHRSQMTSEFGAATLDKAVIAFWCKSCETHVPDPSLRTIAHVGYSDLDSFGSSAIRLGKILAKQESPDCSKCGKQSKLLHFDLFSYHEAAGADLVARAFAPRSLLSRWKTQYFWWSPSRGFVEVEALSQHQATEFTLSLLVRRLEVESMLENPDIDSIVTQGEKCLEQMPGHPTLLSMIPPLIQWGRTGLAGAIAEAHTELNPEDAQGHAWLGEILQLVINRGALPMEHLPEAVASLERALELDPNHSGAKMSLATCHRITGQEDLARDLYQDLTSVESVSAMAHYNLGIMDLGAGESLSALEHFQAGESLDPEDPDYPLGIARACIALGRKAQAKEALNRAMEIAPDHPRIEEIESQLGEYPANEQ